MHIYEIFSNSSKLDNVELNKRNNFKANSKQLGPETVQAMFEQCKLSSMFPKCSIYIQFSL